jgi:hypothetical protein
MKIVSRNYFPNDIKPQMKREDFVKKNFKAYQLIEFIEPYTDEIIECMLVSINFDTEILMLRPFPTETRFINNDDFHVHISQCRIAGRKLKPLK